jgi:hypothetical protein
MKKKTVLSSFSGVSEMDSGRDKIALTVLVGYNGYTVLAIY